MAATAKKYGISLIFGYPERDGKRFIIPVWQWGRMGSCIQNIRKVNLWKSEKKRFSEGRDFPVFETCAGQTAAVLCYDLEFPEPARIVSMNGARLIFCPAAWSFAAERRWRSLWLQPLSAIWPLRRSQIIGMKKMPRGSCAHGSNGRQRSPEKEIPIELSERGRKPPADL